MGKGSSFSEQRVQYRKPIPTVSLGAVGLAWAGRSKVGDAKKKASGGGAGGGQACLDVLVPTNFGDTQTGTVNGWGMGGCYAALYDSEGFLQHRAEVRLALLIADAQLRIFPKIGFIGRQDLQSPERNQYGGLIGLGVNYYFIPWHKKPSIKPFLGGSLDVFHVRNSTSKMTAVDLQIQGGFELRF